MQKYFTSKILFLGGLDNVMTPRKEAENYQHDQTDTVKPAETSSKSSITEVMCSHNNTQDSK